MKNKIKAVVFDYGGVIEISPFNLTANILDSLNVTKEEWQKTYQLYNHLTNVEGKSWKEVALLVAEKLGADKEQIEKISGYIVEHENSRKLNTQLLEIIKTLKKKGFKIGILSNYTSVLRQKIIEQKLSHLFDVVVISQEEGYQKPNPKLFEIAFLKLQVLPLNSVFVDDTPRSLESAKEIGYTPILYTDNKSLKNSLSEILKIKL